MFNINYLMVTNITSKTSSTFFLIFLTYKKNNKIRTIRLTTTIIVNKNIEKKNEMIRKISV